MNFSLPSGTIALIPASRFTQLKRYNECIRNFCCEIRGRDAQRCVSALSPMEHELEVRKDGTFRIHKPTEPQARLIQKQAENWVAASPESRVVEAAPLSTDDSAQEARDVSNLEIGNAAAASFSGGIAITGGPWSVEVEAADDGTVLSVRLLGPAQVQKSVPVVAVAKEPEAPEAEPVAEEEPPAPEPEPELEPQVVEASAPEPKENHPTKRASKTPRRKASPRRRPTKKTK